MPEATTAYERPNVQVKEQHPVGNSRYHGERANSKTAYGDALISSWKNGNTMPFIFDTVWDLIKVAEYLTKREDIDPQRVGITGISLGGMHAWFAAAVDTRYSVAAPLIGVQVPSYP
ncbi:hypothetical protein Bca52824_025302 [Brassica carinata]|uniref:Peptidase S9 prolyl oligopeptidase catalytic domain-containing protein n=1 Tax=Brassica carinata TaxID=52824 RepID=A0A8X7VLX8_BRACI|nr:hypothetical protein Bca52824_025302 [Brassica carinata]